MRSNEFGRSTLALLLGASLLWLGGCGSGLEQARLTEGDGSKASERQGIHERRRLVAIAPGSARLTFTSSGVSQSLTIRVLARPHQAGAPS